MINEKIHYRDERSTLSQRERERGGGNIRRDVVRGKERKVRYAKRERERERGGERERERQGKDQERCSERKRKKSEIYRKGEREDRERERERERERNKIGRYAEEKKEQLNVLCV